MLDTYAVTVRRSGVSPIRAEMLVAADSKRAAGELASVIAEQERGGIFEVANVRRIPAIDPGLLDAPPNAA
jgi:hypothetical protein